VGPGEERRAAQEKNRGNQFGPGGNKRGVTNAMEKKKKNKKGLNKIFGKG